MATVEIQKSKKDDAFTRAFTPAFDERKNVCWITGFEDTYGSGLVVNCHIYDKVLLPDGDERIYDPQNLLKLTPSVHCAWDARLITFYSDGTMVSCLSIKQLCALGIKPNARLPKDILTPRRKKYLEGRLNEYGAWHLASQLALANKRRRLEEMSQ